MCLPPTADHSRWLNQVVVAHSASSRLRSVSTIPDQVCLNRCGIRSLVLSVTFAGLASLMAIARSFDALDWLITYSFTMTAIGPNGISQSPIDSTVETMNPMNPIMTSTVAYALMLLPNPIVTVGLLATILLSTTGAMLLTSVCSPNPAAIPCAQIPDVMAGISIACQYANDR